MLKTVFNLLFSILYSQGHLHSQTQTYTHILLLKANLLLLIIQQWKSYTSPSSIITMN